MIRLLTDEDFALYKAIRLEAMSDAPNAFGATYEETLKQSDEGWKKVLSDTYIFGFFDAGRLVAVAGYFTRPSQKVSHRATLFTIYVYKSHRGKGIMDALLKAIAPHAREKAVELLQLEVDVTNDAARLCYERNGFAVYATQPHSMKVGSTYIDHYLMMKQL